MIGNVPELVVQWKLSDDHRVFLPQIHRLFEGMEKDEGYFSAGQLIGPPAWMLASKGRFFLRGRTRVRAYRCNLESLVLTRPDEPEG